MIEKVLALSTGHMPSPHPFFGSDIRVLNFKYGFLVFAQEKPKDIERWLKPIMDHAVENECTLILFDRDATNDPELFKMYDW